MDRRKALGALGISTAGLATGTAAPADHPALAAQGASPLGGFHLFLCAFHIAKKDPQLVIEAHHYCMPLEDEVHQCIIFDSNGKKPRILGVEYIISDKLYRKLPDGEKKYYHPHTYEVTAGLLTAPHLKGEHEHKLMAGLLTTWGKTWHTWPDPKTALPMGEPLLMWSASRDGQVSPEMLAARDSQLKISTPEIRKRRSVIGPVPQVHPPRSVDDLGRQWTNEGPDVPQGK